MPFERVQHHLHLPTWEHPGDPLNDRLDGKADSASSFLPTAVNVRALSGFGPAPNPLLPLGLPRSGLPRVPPGLSWEPCHPVMSTRLEYEGGRPLTVHVNAARPDGDRLGRD